MHPLRAVLEAVAGGSFPPPDGRCDVLPPDAAGIRAVVSFTGHSYVLADADADELARRGADGFGGASRPDVVTWLAGPGGHVGSLDVVLVATASGGTCLDRRFDLGDHPRVRRAVHYRHDVEVYGDDVGLVVLGHGLAGRREISVELIDPDSATKGHGRRLIRSGLGCLQPGERCWAQVAPGNASSLRAFLACGFVPVGSEVLITPRVGSPA
jgi:hypothetical protein